MNIATCRSVIDRSGAGGMLALHVGSLAVDPLRPPEQYLFDDLHVLIREDDISQPAPRPFRDAMEAGGAFSLVHWDPAANTAIVAPPALIQARLYNEPLPLTPRLGYSHASMLGPPCTLWIQFYTNLRHGPLLLIDLAGWFAPGFARVEQVLGNRYISRPPNWALVLWQASLVTNCAADLADPTVIRAELDKLHEVARQLSDPDWARLVHTAQDYDREYRGRLERIRPTIQTYAAARGVPVQRLIAASSGPADVAAADLDYGVLYDLRYALEALDARHPGTVPAQVPGIGDLWQAVRGGTGARPRKLWHYPVPPGNIGELGIAQAGLGISDQIGPYSNLNWHQLIAQGLVSVEIAGAPPNGYWEGLTPAEFQAIFAPPPP